ncbi:MAG TPA: winged helix-turn-helix domain-containing protein [Candidatus Acidoferrales bacterium]|jgi:two-component system copper resistance phosphate regulon response regulator CusR|nr:winged helix-turn-helix domain-containing protein [Candidatus Acidoferrales bacterium]
MRILLVEDETQTAQYLRKGLVENGFAVDVAQPYTERFDASNRTLYDLLVCDVVPGWPRLSELRRAGQKAPVLFLANRDSVPCRTDSPAVDSYPVDGYLVDNYLVKPFAFSDFLARVHGLLSWGPDRSSMMLVLADLELDLIRHRAERAHKRLDLTPKEFLLLSLLMRRAGEVLSRTFIADQIWEINFESNTNFVDVHIRRLRSKVDDPFPRKLIHTVRGMGYVLEER